jgi:hypothetical protein
MVEVILRIESKERERREERQKNEKQMKELNTFRIQRIHYDNNYNYLSKLTPAIVPDSRSISKLLMDPAKPLRVFIFLCVRKSHKSIPPEVSATYTLN